MSFGGKLTEQASEGVHTHEMLPIWALPDLGHSLRTLLRTSNYSLREAGARQTSKLWEPVFLGLTSKLVLQYLD